MASRLTSILTLCALIGCSLAQGAEVAFVAVHFPKVELRRDDGERITGFVVNASCASFDRLERIPDDWSVVISSPVSAVSHCTGDCGHGASALLSLSDLDGVVSVRVAPEDQKCFEVTATVQTTMRNLTFTHSQLVGSQASNQSPKPTPSAVH